MEQDLKRFEDKLNHFVTLFQRLRAENNELRQSLAMKSDEVKRLGEKLAGARERIENLLARLPEAGDAGVMDLPEEPDEGRST